MDKYKLFLFILSFGFVALAIDFIVNKSNNSGYLLWNGKNYVVPGLPYSYNALEPYIDKETMKIHHDKHHQAYVDNLNIALNKYPEYLGKDLEWLIKNFDTIPQEIRKDVKNNAGGHLNHSMFWLMLSGKSSKEPSEQLKKDIEEAFGSFDKFKDQFSLIAKKLFGSGWTWLCLDKNNKLVITTTEDQGSPISQNLIPILGLDVWEHAYYLKYQNRRIDYIQAWWNVVNWDYVESLYKKSKIL